MNHFIITNVIVPNGELLTLAPNLHFFEFIERESFFFIRDLKSISFTLTIESPFFPDSTYIGFTLKEVALYGTCWISFNEF